MKQTEMDLRPLAAFQEALDRDGLAVTPGLAGALNPAEEYCAGTADNALYANNEPYVQVQVPKPAQERHQLSTIFQMRPEEAVVLIGLTPPPVRYFSYGPYLWSKKAMT